MQDIQEGVILELEGDLARVRVSAHSDCDNCQMCNAAGMVILAYNPLKAVPGQKVKFIDAQGGMLKISFMLFFFPLISVLAGLYIGSVLSSVFQFNKTGAMFTGALLLLLVSIGIIVFYDKKYKLNKSNFPQIIEVIL